MSQKFPGFKWVENSFQFDEGCFFEVDVQYPEELRELRNVLPYFPERMKMETDK